MSVPHSEAVERLPLFASGSLRGAVREDLEAHVRQCSSCREWLETYLLLWRGLGARHAVEHVQASELALLVVNPQELDEPGMEDVRAHLASCSACQLELDLVSAAIEDAKPGRELAPEVVSVTPVLRRKRFLLAAGVAIAILGAAALLQEPYREYRRGDAPRIARGSEAVTPATRLVHTSLQGARVFEAEGRLEVAQVDVAGGADITLRARDRVVFGEGFRVGPNAKLAVEVGASFRNGAAQGKPAEDG